MMQFLLVAFVVLTVGLPTASFADWQYTKCGMSVEELLSTDKANVVRTTPKEQKYKSIATVGEALARTTYVADDVKFVVIFYFHGNKLSGVNLTLGTLDEALRIRNRLELAYGKPFHAQEKKEYGGSCIKSGRTWRSEQDQNVIEFHAYYCIKIAPYNGMAFYNILYQPVLPPKKLGL